MATSQYTRPQHQNWIVREAAQLKRRLMDKLLAGVSDVEERTLIKVQVNSMDVREVQRELRALAGA